MARPTYNISGTAMGASTGEAVTVTVGAGSNRCAYYFILNRDAGGGDVTGVSCTGGSMAQIGTTIADGNAKWRAYRYVEPGTGSFTVTPTISGTRAHIGILMVLNGVDQTTPEGTLTQAAAKTATVNISDDQLLLTFHGTENSGLPAPPIFTPSGTATQTEYHDVGLDAYGYYGVSSLTPTTATPATGAFTSTGGDSLGIFAIPVNGVTGGGSTQPPRSYYTTRLRRA